MECNLPTATTWRNRIIRTAEVAPDQLLANAKNWRIHPKHQQDALSGVLDEVGWVQQVIVRDGTDTVVDGHLRVSLALQRNEPLIPVLYVDLDDAEEALVLATIDPLAALAVTDAAKLDDLLRDVATGEAAVQEMLAELAEREGIVPPDFEPVGIDQQGRLDEKAQATCPECGHVFTPELTRLKVCNAQVHR